MTQATFCFQLQFQHKWIEQLLVTCHKAGQKELDSPNQRPWSLVPGWVLNKCLYGEAPPRGPTPYPLIYNLSRKRYPFCIPSIDKWYPFNIPRLELCIPFNCCKSARLSNRNQSQKLNLTFSRLYKALKFICYPFWGPFTDPNDRFPYPFIYIN